MNSVNSIVGYISVNSLSKNENINKNGNIVKSENLLNPQKNQVAFTGKIEGPGKLFKSIKASINFLKNKNVDKPAQMPKEMLEHNFEIVKENR